MTEEHDEAPEIEEASAAEASTAEPSSSDAPEAEEQGAAPESTSPAAPVPSEPGIERYKPRKLVRPVLFAVLFPLMFVSWGSFTSCSGGAPRALTSPAHGIMGLELGPVIVLWTGLVCFVLWPWFAERVARRWIRQLINALGVVFSFGLGIMVHMAAFFSLFGSTSRSPAGMAGGALLVSIVLEACWWPFYETAAWLQARRAAKGVQTTSEPEA